MPFEMVSGVIQGWGSTCCVLQGEGGFGRFHGVFSPISFNGTLLSSNVLDSVCEKLTVFHWHYYYYYYYTTTVLWPSGFCPVLPGWAGTRKVKPKPIWFPGIRDSEWQWYQLGHIQICTSPQTDNRASIPLLIFYRLDALPASVDM